MRAATVGAIEAAVYMSTVAAAVPMAPAARSPRARVPLSVAPLLVRSWLAPTRRPPLAVIRPEKVGLLTTLTVVLPPSATLPPPLRFVPAVTVRLEFTRLALVTVAEPMSVPETVPSRMLVLVTPPVLMSPVAIVPSRIMVEVTLPVPMA